MFKPIPEGTKINIEGPEADYECWIPPVGFGSHIDTGEVKETDIIKRSEIQSEQKWERPKLPDNWNELVAKEANLKKQDKDYSDTFLNFIRAREWKRRLYGVWFWNNGELCYITGLHYMLLTHWPFQRKYFDYRKPNRDYYYVLQYCIEDPDCLGLIEVTKRKEGKTARAGLFVYEYISRTAGKHGGIQSKTDSDAEEVLQKAVVTPWRKLPEFFRPVFDKGGGDNPSKAIRFFNTSQRGKVRNEEDPALESFIDTKPALPEAYDGPELHRYVSDEAGKLKKHSILERHQVVMFCSEVDGLFVGKQLYTTTVEEMEAGGAEFKKLVEQSNRTQRDANNRTKSGLYVYFLPAYKTMFYDDYGNPDEARGRIYFMNRRVSLQDDPHSLSSFIRKNPFTLAECFRIDGDKCIYNSELLNDQNDAFAWKRNLTTRGNFVWLNAERDTKVVWENDKNGKFEVCWLFPNSEDSNNISKVGNFFKPNNSHLFASGADTFSHDIVKDQRRSKGAMAVKMKFDSTSDDPYNDCLLALYHARPASAAIQYEDMLMMAVYYGVEVLFESNKNGWKDYFVTRGYEAFLMKLKAYPDYGIPGNEKTRQELTEATEGHILHRSKTVFFQAAITDWLEFEYHNTTKYDVAMATGYTFIADKKKVFRLPDDKLKRISDYGFTKHKIA